MGHGMRRRASFIALGVLAALAISLPAKAGGVVVAGTPVIVTPPPAAPPPVIPHRLRIVRPAPPPLAPVIVVPPMVTAPSGLVTAPIVIRQGKRLFLVAPGVFVPIR
jgi:hypothetical protein